MAANTYQYLVVMVATGGAGVSDACNAQGALGWQVKTVEELKTIYSVSMTRIVFEKIV